MRSRGRSLAVLCVLAFAGVFGALSASSATRSAWDRAIHVPLGDFGSVTSVSCATAGNCAAGGWSFSEGSVKRLFVVDETNGKWGRAMEVPGLATLGSGGQNTGLSAVSCAAAGNCAAGGYYTDGSGDTHAFVVDEKNGRWAHAIELRGTGGGEVASLSCAAAGNCAAGGNGFVVDETNGRWGTAIEVPGTVNSVSCPSAGNCAAGGFFTAGNWSNQQAFVVDETDGVWGTAIEVPGTAPLNSGNRAEVVSVSCAAPGECAAGGYYLDGSGVIRAFLVDEKNGSWGSAIEVPGTASLGGGAGVSSVSCVTVGNCAAVGGYKDSSDTGRVFVVDETNGRWGDAIEVPGTPAPAAGDLYPSSISCAAPGECAAGVYAGNQAYVADETDGRWGAAVKLRGGSWVFSVSCATAGNCAAGGEAITNNGSHGFMVDSHSARATLDWSPSRGGHPISSYNFGAVGSGSTVSRWFRLGSAGLSRSGSLAISVTGSTSFSVASDRCTGKSIGPNLSCWVRVTYAPHGAPASDSATLTATGLRGTPASLSLSGTNTG